VIVADGTSEAARRLERVLTNDPTMGILRHADAGYELARKCARERGVKIVMPEGRTARKDRARPRGKTRSAP